MKPITFDTFVRGILAIALVAGLLWLLSRLSSVLLPFFLAWLIAYLLFPLVKFFQYRCRLRFRVVAIIAALLTVGLVVTGLVWLMVPPMIEEGLRAKDMLVAYFERNITQSNIPDMAEQWLREHFSADEIKQLVTQEGFIQGMKEALPKVWAVVAQSISVVSSFFTVTMIVLYTVFILIDYEKFSTGWADLLPERYRRIARRLVSDIGDGMNKYFRGQAIVAFCVGVLFSIGFLIIDFPMAIGLGMFIGLLNMVPYLQLVGFVPTILLAIVKAADTGQNFWIIMLMALIVFAVVQTIQDAFLTPKIMGHVTGLNSAIILLSLSIWGSLLGILGMIIALPLTTLLITYYQKYIVKEKTDTSAKPSHQ
jgi:predicted PurR-regulated permease PerM